MAFGKSGHYSLPFNVLIQTIPESNKELIPHFFYMQGLTITQYGGVLMFEPVRFDLQDIRIDLSFPKPLGPAKLNIFRIEKRDAFQCLKQFPARIIFLNAETNIGNPVFHFLDGIGYGQGIEVMGIFPITVNKMAIATLQSETTGYPVKGPD